MPFVENSELPGHWKLGLDQDNTKVSHDDFVPDKKTYENVTLINKENSDEIGLENQFRSLTGNVDKENSDDIDLENQFRSLTGNDLTDYEDSNESFQNNQLPFSGTKSGFFLNYLYSTFV